MGLAAAFSYLALQALRNVSLFAVVAGFVLAANLGPWVNELAAVIPAPGRQPWIRSATGLAMRVALAGLAGLIVLAIASGRFSRGTGDSRQFGLSAEPLTYAHDAARFAGRPGLPDRALVYDTRQAGVYLFHNGPQRKVFLDGRLEVPRRETFETYVRLDRVLNSGRPGWKQALAQMGDPLILLEHEVYIGAEATLLADPDWRCIYYDAIASVFVSRRRRDLEASFPSVDFAARHFQSSLHDPAWPAVLPAPSDVARARALLGLAWAVRSRPGRSWQLPSSLVLLAGDYLRRAIVLEPTAADTWNSLGLACWNMVADPTAFRPHLVEPWDPARGLLPAQAAFCFRRALELNPEETVAAQLLDQVLRVKGTSDTEPARTIPRQRGSAEADGRPIRRDWPACDRVATTLLHLGHPAEARRVWASAADPPAPALRLARLAAADLAALDFAAAERTYRAALELDPALSEAWVGLAVLHTERGDAAAVLAAAHRGLKHPLTPAQDVLLRDLEALAAPYAPLP
jgi:tetratricopeptide (TPR) repeat protein